MWTVASVALVLVGAAQGDKAVARVTLADLDKLVALYKELKLPIPPPDAPLIQTGGSGSYADDQGTHEAYSCGYLISKGKDRRSKVMSGTIVSDDYGYDGKLIEPVAKSANAIFLSSSFGPPFEEDSGLALAVIERTRGHDEFALAVLQRTTEWWVSSYGSYSLGRPGYPSAPAKASALVRLRYLALQHWFNLIVDPQLDRANVVQGLSDLTKSYPELRNSFVSETIADLKTTVTQRYQGTDEVERLIDSLCEVQVDGSQLSSPDPSQKPKFVLLLNLVSYGYEAIPKLIAHVTDKRYTRAISPAFMNSPSSLVTVGEVCANLAEQFSTEKTEDWRLPARKKALEKWWATASTSSERDNCLEKLIKSDSFPPEAPIRWAERRFPDLLLEAYDDILKKGKSTQTYQLLEAMQRSKLDRKTIIEAAVRGSSSTNLDHVHAAIWTLEKLDMQKFDQALLAMLKRLPKSPTGPAWLSREGSFAQQVGYSDSSEVWAALGDATRRADVDLRLELIQHAAYANHTKSGRKELFKYLLSFFGDTAMPVHKKPTQDDPFPDTGHFVLASERVQDLAASVAANELDVKGIPKSDAPKSEWDAFRARVKEKIEEALKATSAASG